MKPERVIIKYWKCGKYKHKHDTEEDAQLCIDAREKRKQLIEKFGACVKCDGEGWVWGHELEHYQVDDNSRYPCDKCRGVGYNEEEEDER